MTIKNKFDPKEVIYYGIENGNSIITRKNLSDLTQIPYIGKFYLRRDFNHEAPNNYGNGTLPYYYYKIVDKEDKRAKIKVGNFEITEIEPEVNYYGRLDHRNIKIFDKKNDVYRTYVSKTHGDNFIIKDLLFLIDKLKVVSDWQTLMDYLRIPALEEKIKSLENELTQLKNSMSIQQNEDKAP